MYPHTARYGSLFILIHWAAVLLLALLFAVGWYIHLMPPTAPARRLLLDLHGSLGLTSALLVSVQIVLRLLFKTPPFPDLLPLWQRRLAGSLYLLLYVVLILMPLSGYLQAVFSTTPVYFWGMPIPVRGVLDADLSAFFLRLHGIAAWILAGLILLHIGIVVINTFNGAGMASRMLVGKEQESNQLLPAEANVPAAPTIGYKLGRNLRLFGWLGFGLQFVLAFIAGLLLMIAAPGRAFSPGAINTGDGMYWASKGFFLLCVAVLLTLYYIHAAGKLQSKPDAYLTPRKKVTFWFLGAGMFSGFSGIFMAFAGMLLSMSLLVAKTVSQPPGIAITDPQKIIRALDVFVLMANFDLLLAHFIGAGISLWLGLRASKARLEYRLLLTNL